MRKIYKIIIRLNKGVVRIGWHKITTKVCIIPIPLFLISLACTWGFSGFTTAIQQWLVMDIAYKSTIKKYVCLLFVSGILVNVVHSHSISHVGSCFRCIMGVKWVGRGVHYVLLPQEKSEVTALLTLSHF